MTKKILALLVSLVLMCSSIGAVAEENYTTTLRFDLAAEELLMLSGAEFGEEEEAIADILLPLIEKLNFKLITADEQMQLSLAIDDAAIASLTGGISGDQIVIVSDLFPSCYLSLSLETLESLMLEAAAVMPQIDTNAEAAMEEAIDAAVNNLIETLSGHIGQVENGTFVVDGETFTEKLPLNISVEELALLFMNLFKDLAADPTMATMFTMMDADPSMLDDVVKGVTGQLGGDAARKAGGFLSKIRSLFSRK